MRRNICCARPEISANQSGGIENSAFAVGWHPLRSLRARSSISSNAPSPDWYAAQMGVAVLVSRTIAAIPIDPPAAFAASLIALGKPSAPSNKSQLLRSNRRARSGVNFGASMGQVVAVRLVSREQFQVSAGGCNSPAVNKQNPIAGGQCLGAMRNNYHDSL